MLAAGGQGADVETAEASFQQALAIARRQGARSLELRAATSLTRLYRDRALRAQARGVIRPIYEQFEEGFDTVDLKAARDLLEEL